MVRLQMIFFLVLTSISTGYSQDVKQLLEQFPKATLPYDFPEGASSDFGDDPFEHPYKQLDIATFNQLTGAFIPDDSELFAVHQLSYGQYHVLVVFEFAFNRITGMIERQFVLYTIDAQGKLIDQRLACTYEFYNQVESFGISSSHSILYESEYEGEKGILILATTRTDDFNATEGNYNEEVRTITTTYEAVDPSGKIRDVTSYLKK